jgi:hypothetical protein
MNKKALFLKKCIKNIGFNRLKKHNYLICIFLKIKVYNNHTLIPWLEACNGSVPGPIR